MLFQKYVNGINNEVTLSLVDYYAVGELWWQLLQNLVPSCISDVASLMSFMPRFRVILESFNLCDAPLYEGKSCLMEFP